MKIDKFTLIFSSKIEYDELTVFIILNVINQKKEWIIWQKIKNRIRNGNLK